MANIPETGQYEGAHALIISDTLGNTKNTFTDWHLVPASRPSVAPPSVKTKIIENPGGDGIIDVSQAVTRFPLYGQREGSWDFYVLNGWKLWEELYSEMLNFFHGKNVQVTLTDDPLFYYNGRLSFNQWLSDKDRSKITLNYNFDPYKLYTQESINIRWIWDTFNFTTDVILASKMKNIEFNGTKTISFTGDEVGRRPVTPTFRIVGTCTEISLTNPELWGSTPVTKTVGKTDSGSKDYHWMDMIFSGFNGRNPLSLTIKGHGTLSIVYRPGKL